MREKQRITGEKATRMKSADRLGLKPTIQLRRPTGRAASSMGSRLSSVRLVMSELELDTVIVQAFGHVSPDTCSTAISTVVFATLIPNYPRLHRLPRIPPIGAYLMQQVTDGNPSPLDVHLATPRMRSIFEIVVLHKADALVEFSG